VEKVRYMISDAANIAGVESHVLRYWEDELELDIPRNEMGHRYYTKENIQQFQRIKELKEQGYQLKSIRMILHNNGVEPRTAAKEEHLLATKEERPAAAKEERLAITGEGRPAEPE
jgi:DNA-binding transcriptional MerR regulator